MVDLGDRLCEGHCSRPFGGDRVDGGACDCRPGTAAFHGLVTLGVFAAFPFVYGNLQFVWIGVATHYVLDLLGANRGMALFYPWPEEYDVPVGVNVDSPWADVVTLAVTGVELAVVWAALDTGVHVAALDALRGLV